VREGERVIKGKRGRKEERERQKERNSERERMREMGKQVMHLKNLANTCSRSRRDKKKRGQKLWMRL